MNDEQVIGEIKSALALGIGDAETMGAVMGSLEALRPKLLELRVERYKTLCKSREQYRHPKDKEYTDFDRKTMLEAAMADVQADYELVAGLEKLVAERVELIKVLLETK